MKTSLEIKFSALNRSEIIEIPKKLKADELLINGGKIITKTDIRELVKRVRISVGSNLRDNR